MRYFEKGKKTSLQRCTLLYLIAALSLISLSGPTFARLKPEHPHNVLILNSYHPEYIWTRNLMEGMNSVLGQYSNDELLLDVEYMDTRRISDEKHYENLYTLYKHKLAGNNYDVIIITDDNAFKFFLKHRDDLFPDTPAVFCGINDDALIPKDPNNMTGIIETHDYKYATDIILKLHPSLERLVCIVDEEADSYPKWMAVLSENLEKFREHGVKIDIHMLSEIGKEALLLEKISDLGTESVVLLTVSFIDAQGRTLPLKKSSEILLQKCQAPIYSLAPEWFEFGFVTGGSTVTGFNYGKATAERAVRILDGQSADDIPIIWDGVSGIFQLFSFDYRQLKRFGIAISELPKGSIIINQPQTFYYKYKQLVWTVMAVIAALTVIIIMLTANNLRRKRAEQALIRVQTIYRQAIQNARGIPYQVVLPENEYVFIGSGAKELLGLSSKMMRELKFPSPIYKMVIVSPNPSKNLVAMCEAINRNDKINTNYYRELVREEATGGQQINIQLDYQTRTPDGRTKWINDSFFYLTDEHTGKVTGAIGILQDITERKLAEQKLQQAHDLLESRVAQRTAELAKAVEELEIEIVERKKSEEKLVDHQKQLQSMASELSLAEERLRRRIAVEIHDNISQNLAISKIKLESLTKDPSSPNGLESANQIRQLLTDAIENIRSLTFELSPPVLYELGFNAAIEWLSKQAQQQYGLSATFDGDSNIKEPQENVRILLFQAARELLVNVAKHAQAGNVTISVRGVDSSIEVRVEDDGIGFDVSEILSRNQKTPGFGFFSIRERLTYIGGNVIIDSEPGAGTRITLRAPINLQS